MKNLFKSLLEFQSECPEIAFDASVSYNSTKFKYATLGNIIKTVRPILTNVQLGFFQTINEGQLTTTLYHSSGEEIKSAYQLPEITKPQDLGKWITYVKRYQLASILGIVADQDNDGKGVDPLDVTKKAIKLKLKSIKTIADLTDLYNANTKTIKGDLALLNAFTEKKESL